MRLDNEPRLQQKSELRRPGKRRLRRPRSELKKPSARQPRLKKQKLNVNEKHWWLERRLKLRSEQLP